MGSKYLESFDTLGDKLMLFGEWCAARHSLGYDRLDDLFLTFDVYDISHGRFWSTARRNELARSLGIALVPRIARGRFTLQELIARLGAERSSLRDGEVEGYYLRREKDLWLEDRAKLVKPGFTLAIEDHWSKRETAWNRVEGDYGSL